MASPPDEFYILHWRTFCTPLERRPFDIQCVPIQLTRSVSLDILEAIAIEPIVANSKSREIALWALEAAEDAVSAEEVRSGNSCGGGGRSK